MADAILDAEKKLDRIMSAYPIFLQAERKLGMKKTRILASFLVSTIMLGLLHFVADAFTALVVFAYPAAMSVTAIESDNKAEDVHWLTYWMVLSLLNTVEVITGGWIKAIVPFYIITKLVFCVWLFLPQTQGATIVYQRVVQPLVAMYRQSPLYVKTVESIKKGADVLSKGVASSAKTTMNFAKAANAVNNAKGEVAKAVLQETENAVDGKEE